VKVTDKNLAKKMRTMMDGKIPFMAQKFLPQVKKGDKRVLVLGGKFLGSVNRVPKTGSFLANFGRGGIGKKTTLTAKEKKIVETVGPFLLTHGIHFAGLDMIGEHLTEINITCPTGVMQINRLENKKLEKEIVGYFKELSKRKSIRT
jgi:glutathione synthase